MPDSRLRPTGQTSWSVSTWGIVTYFPQRMILHDRYKYVFSIHDMNELYDLQDDPFEMNNLVRDRAIRRSHRRYEAAPDPAF